MNTATEALQALAEPVAELEAMGAQIVSINVSTTYPGYNPSIQVGGAPAVIEAFGSRAATRPNGEYTEYHVEHKGVDVLWLIQDRPAQEAQ